MQLNSVVLPASLGPMMPTISHSPARRLTSWSALMPPKWMLSESTSSTDIVHLHLGHRAGVPVEAVSGEPEPDGSDLLPDPAGVLRQGQQQQDRPDDQAHELRRDAEPMGEDPVDVEQLAEQAEE